MLTMTKALEIRKHTTHLECRWLNQPDLAPLCSALGEPRPISLATFLRRFESNIKGPRDLPLVQLGGHHVFRSLWVQCTPRKSLKWLQKRLKLVPIISHCAVQSGVSVLPITDDHHSNPNSEMMLVPALAGLGPGQWWSLARVTSCSPSHNSGI